MIKLALFDMDGTLLDGHRQLPADFSAWVKRFRERGTEIAIASARPAQLLKNTFPEDLDDLLISGENGKLFFRGQQFLKSYPMPWQDVQRVLQRLSEDADVASVMFSLQDTYVTERDYAKLLQWDQQWLFPQPPKILQEEIQTCQLHCYFRGGQPAALKKLHEEYADLQTQYDMQLSGSAWVDVMEKGVDKGNAVRFFADYLDISKDEIAVFGDDENDISMFREVRYSFAMKNASSYVQSQAAYVTALDHTQNGALQELWALTDSFLT